MKRLVIFLVVLSSISYYAHAQKDSRLVVNSGHANKITHLTFSKSGKFLFSGSKDASVKIWDVASQKLLKTLRGFPAAIKAICTNPEETHIYVGSGKEVWVYDLTNFKKIGHFDTYQQGLNFIYFLDSKNQLVTTGYRDYAIKQWDASSFRLVETIRLGSVSSYTTATTPDENQLLISPNYANEFLYIMDLDEQKMIHQFNKSKFKKMLGVVASPDGQAIYAGGEESNIKKYTRSSPEPVWSADVGSRVQSLSISPDGKYLVSGADRSLKLWDTSSGQAIKTLQNSSEYILKTAISPDSKLLVSGGNDNTISIWDLSTGEFISTLGSAASSITDLAASSKQNTVINSTEDGYIRVWDMITGRLKKSWKAHDKPITSIALSPNERRLLTGSWDNTAKYWNINSGALVKKYGPFSNWVESVALSGDGNKLALGGMDYHIMIYSAKTHKLLKDINRKSGSHGAMSFNTTGSQIMINDGFKLITYSTTTGSLIKTEKYRSILQSISPSKQNPWYITGEDLFAGSGSDWKSRKFDIGQIGSSETTFSLEGQKIHFEKLSYTPQQQMAAAKSNDGTINIWNLQGEPIHQTLSSAPIAHTFTSEIGKAVFFDPKGDKLYDTSPDGAVKVIRLDTKEEIVRCIGQGDEWLTVTPDFYFTSTRNISDVVHYISDNEVYRFDQFDLQYNRPDIILERLATAPKNMIRLYKKAYEKRLSKMGFQQEELQSSFYLNAPTVDIIEDIPYQESTNSEVLSFHIQAKDKSEHIDRLFVTVNGVPLYGIKGKPTRQLKSNDIEQLVTLSLTPGTNTVQVSVMNAQGVESLKKELVRTYNPREIKKPDLHVFAVGVSKFLQSDYNLTYADKDAIDISNLFENATQNYEKIHVHTLTNEQVTRKNVLKLKSELVKTSIDDEVIFFIASHGLINEDLDYYIATHDTNFENPIDGGLLYDDLESMLDKIPARKKLMLVDACHSGEIDKEESVVTSTQPTTSSSVKSRGFKTIESPSALGLKSSFELMKELFTDIRRNNGTVVISSASGKEFAYESAEWQNGVFTFAVLEGLKTRKSDTDQNGTVQVSELRDYVFDRVKKLTSGQQNPTSRQENLENDFTVW